MSQQSVHARTWNLPDTEESQHVIDAVGNDVFTITGAAAIIDNETKADNPDMATPPAATDDASDSTTVWDGTALGDDSSAGTAQ